jgi:hypothetical protein
MRFNDNLHVARRGKNSLTSAMKSLAQTVGNTDINIAISSIVIFMASELNYNSKEDNMYLKLKNVDSYCTGISL